MKRRGIHDPKSNTNESSPIELKPRRTEENKCRTSYECAYNFQETCDEITDDEKSMDIKTKKHGIRTYCCRGIILVVVIFIPFLVYELKPNYKINLTQEMKGFKEKYNKQNEALWRNVWKIINDSEKNVHSFILLYKRNGAAAAECFAKDLVKVINKIHGKTNIITYQYRDVEYGAELVKYLELVKENKHLIVPRLQEMKGDIARMFHSLCDDGYDAIRPSYFIFTLEDGSDKIHSDLSKENPYKKVGMILRNEWSNLLENELHPLISRIAKNVAEISALDINDC